MAASSPPAQLPITKIAACPSATRFSVSVQARFALPGSAFSDRARRMAKDSVIAGLAAMPSSFAA